MFSSNKTTYKQQFCCDSPVKRGFVWSNVLASSTKTQKDKLQHNNTKLVQRDARTEMFYRLVELVASVKVAPEFQ